MFGKNSNGYFLINDYIICCLLKHFLSISCYIRPKQMCFLSITKTFLHATITQWKRVLGDRSTNKMTANVCNEIVILLALTWLLQRQSVAVFKATLVGKDKGKLETWCYHFAFKWDQVGNYVQFVCDNMVINCNKSVKHRKFTCMTAICVQNDINARQLYF